MIERTFVEKRKKEFLIQTFIADSLSSVGLSHSKIFRTPLGEKIVVYSSRPGLIIGGGGSNIKRLTQMIQEKFNLENPQIEVSEVGNTDVIASVVAEKIKSNFERYGSMRFKGVGHKAMDEVMSGGAQGVEILLSGKIPSAKARTWRFYQGYLKKCGDVSLSQVDVAYATAKLKTGIVGIKVSIMPPGLKLPDKVELLEPAVEEVVEKDTEKVSVDKSVEDKQNKKAKEKKTDTKTKEKKAVTTQKKEDAKNKKIEKKDSPKKIVAKSTEKKATAKKVEKNKEKKSTKKAEVVKDKK